MQAQQSDDVKFTLSNGRTIRVRVRGDVLDVRALDGDLVIRPHGGNIVTLQVISDTTIAHK